MGEAELEKAMLDFIDRKFDVLLATTIIENGLDIPNVNTIIINRADRYGLSQLYQLRGRVGRSDRPAYAYLLIPPEATLSPVAKKRLAAIREFSDLGSGFRVAALDLEIRGAGNLLGGEQSGHIETVGFEMYMKLLEQAVRELKGEDLTDDVRAVVNLRVDLKIDESYVPDMNQRLMIYRKVADARTRSGAGSDPQRAPRSLRSVARDGRAPRAVRQNPHHGGQARRRGHRSRKPDSRHPIQAGYAGNASERGAAAQSHRCPRGYDADSPGDDQSGFEGAFPRQVAAPVGTKAKARQSSGSSWWTARATAGEVTSGFTKAEILKPPKENPNAPGGVFTVVRGLLAELAGIQ